MLLIDPRDKSPFAMQRGRVSLKASLAPNATRWRWRLAADGLAPIESSLASFAPAIHSAKALVCSIEAEALSASGWSTRASDKAIFLPSDGVFRAAVFGGEDDFVARGLTMALEAPQAPRIACGSAPNAIGVQLHALGESREDWSLDFSAPQGQCLGAGLSCKAARYPFQEPGEAGVAFFGAGRGHNTLAGSLAVERLRWDSLPDGQWALAEAFGWVGQRDSAIAFHLGEAPRD